jgi:hypothetical protein
LETHGREFARPHLNQYLGAVVSTCHPSYHGKHKIGGSWSKQARAKEFMRPHVNRNIKSRMWWCTPVIPAMGSIYRRVAVLAALGKK